ncbi:ABC transporter ATP-binding protein [Leifsonia sp. 2MCAF36]|uniref:ABC transporter ATP-binding protein n=1 Tax=Leifsonia sp. 2MCAF36 TaxID=3232988 RepID=UPI003F9BE186
MQVVVRGASIRFGSRSVFEGLSATFPSNQVTALVGPSGSGKSTLLAAIAGFRKLEMGSIELGPQESWVRPSSALVNWIAQDSNILGGRSALDNVMLGPLSEGATLREASQRAARALGRVGLGATKHAPARHLSGGERQRVAVARALSSTRPLILADEPSAALDEVNTVGLADLFAQASGRATIIVATHDPVMIAAASSIVTIRRSPL